MYIRTCVMSFSKAIDPDHDISDHHYYDNYTECSYYCSNYCSILTTITVANIYIKQCNMQPALTYKHIEKLICFMND